MLAVCPKVLAHARYVDGRYCGRVSSATVSQTTGKVLLTVLGIIVNGMEYKAKGNIIMK